MIPQIDLFHQLVMKMDGYTAIQDFTDEYQPLCNIYDPNGEWVGNTGASNIYTRNADIRHIIKWHIKFKQQRT